MNALDLPIHYGDRAHISGGSAGQLPGILRSGLGNRHGFQRVSPDEEGYGWRPPLYPEGERALPLKSFVAQDFEDLAEARALVRRRYARRGYTMPEADGAPFPDPVRAVHYPTIVAKSLNATLGSVTMGVDSPAGLLLDHANKPEVDAIRAEGGHVCELVRLALDDSADTKAVLASLLQCIYTLCWQIYDVTDVLIEVIPRHVPFYRRVLGFVQAADEKICARIGGVPVVLLRLNRHQLEQKLYALRGGVSVSG
jgi:hypothetical protein